MRSSSRTEIPQPLTYLVDDVARRFGSVRVGVAIRFIRSDDEHALLELLHQPWAAALRLHRIAPTVVVSQSPADVVLARIRESGHGPGRRGRRRVGPPHPAGHAARTLDHAGPRAVRRGSTRPAVRRRRWRPSTRSGSGTAPSASRPRSAAATAPDRIIAVLREAAETKGSVWLDYLDRDGAMTQRLVDPVRVEGGWLAAHDERAGEPRRFALHRIQAVHPEG